MDTERYRFAISSQSIRGSSPSADLVLVLLTGQSAIRRALMKKRAKVFSVTLFAVILIAFLHAGCTANDMEQSKVERGQYLVMVGGCEDCHSPKVFSGANPMPDTTRRLSGYPSSSKLPDIPRYVIGPAQWGAITTSDMTAWVGPWGVTGRRESETGVSDYLYRRCKPGSLWRHLAICCRQCPGRQ